ncbi:hypothetical protein MKW92_039638 [Papaver armeniacum]|nr:hypothetical protein MKW92_039638 [Papaver armeniacum]
MEDKQQKSSDHGHNDEFSIGKSAQERGLPYVPDCYVIPPSQRPDENTRTSKDVPVIDISGLHSTPHDRSLVVKDIGVACRQKGFFQIINHGISQSVLDEAITAASNFFELPNKYKQDFMSNDVAKPVRYGTGLKDGCDVVQFWRIFLKHYAHPLEKWIEYWPLNPPDYREKMAHYAVDVRNVAMEVMGAITESLGLGNSYMSEKLEDGMQVMAVNCYPPCSQPDRVLGLPPHTDYSCITILLQTGQGLQVISTNEEEWRLIPDNHGVLHVHVGDFLEVLSNGLYKSVLHRATLNSEKTRYSIASLHSLGMDEKVETAKELVDEQHPKGYKGSTFGDFLKFLSTNDIAEGSSFIENLKIKS